MGGGHHPALHHPRDKPIVAVQLIPATFQVVRLQLPPEYHRATLGDDLSMNDYKWSPDGSRLALVSSSRDHKEAVLKVLAEP